MLAIAVLSEEQQDAPPTPQADSNNPHDTPPTPPTSPTPLSPPAPREVGTEDGPTRLGPSAARPTIRAGAEVAAYRDSVGVSVLTPSVHASVESPIVGYAVNAQYLVDTVSAASPDVVSTASRNWVEVRQGGNLGVKYKPGDFGVAVGANTSYSNDYLALGANATLFQDLDEKNISLVTGYSYGHDTIGRTGTPFSVFSRTLDTHSVTAGLTRTINPSTALGFTLDAIFENGDQSKPYRYIPLFTAAAAATIGRGASPDAVAAARSGARPLEALPLSRQRWAATGHLAMRLTSSTLRLDERVYVDSWGTRASTTDAKLIVDTTRRLALWPHVRVNIQNAVSFWQRAYVSNGIGDIPAVRTGDRELGSLSTLGLGAGARVSLGHSGAVDNLVLLTTVDGSYTSFADALYVKERYTVLVATGLEAAF